MPPSPCVVSATSPREISPFIHLSNSTPQHFTGTRHRSRGLGAPSHWPHACTTEPVPQLGTTVTIQVHVAFFESTSCSYMCQTSTSLPQVTIWRRAYMCGTFLFAPPYDSHQNHSVASNMDLRIPDSLVPPLAGTWLISVLNLRTARRIQDLMRP